MRRKKEIKSTKINNKKKLKNKIYELRNPATWTYNPSFCSFFSFSVFYKVVLFVLTRTYSYFFLFYFFYRFFRGLLLFSCYSLSTKVIEIFFLNCSLLFLLLRTKIVSNTLWTQCQQNWIRTENDVFRKWKQFDHKASI